MIIIPNWIRAAAYLIHIYGNPPPSCRLQAHSLYKSRLCLEQLLVHRTSSPHFLSHQTQEPIAVDFGHTTVLLGQCYPQEEQRGQKSASHTEKKIFTTRSTILVVL